jgi:pyruvate/2-oxoglutarate/acetoin dehydrogenase E1 component
VTYKEALVKEMDKLSQDPKVRFVGYNTAYGPRMHRTLCNIPIEKCIETPVAENLMCGIAMGLALEGFIPVLCFERMDFCLAAADALINHIGGLSFYGLSPKIIIRVCIGSREPLNPGIQHTRDYTKFFYKDSSIDLVEVLSENVIGIYERIIKDTNDPIILVERKELYEQDIVTE